MSATLSSNPALAPFENARQWWTAAAAMPWQRLWEAGIASQRIYADAASQEMSFCFAAQERLRRCCERVSASRRPRDFLDAQADLMATIFETTAQQAKAFEDTAEHLRSCYAAAGIAPEAEVGKPA